MMGASVRGFRTFISRGGSWGRGVGGPLVAVKTSAAIPEIEETIEKILAVIMRLKESVRG